MTTARVQTTAEALRNLRASARIMEKEFRGEVQQALAEGIPAAEIAEAAKISKARVYQIRDGRR